MLEPLSAVLIALIECVGAKIRGPVEHYFGEVDDVWRVLHDIHFDDPQLVVIAQHLGYPEAVYLLGNTPERQSFVRVALIEIRILMAENFDCRAATGFPNVSVCTATEVLVELYAFAR